MRKILLPLLFAFQIQSLTFTLPISCTTSHDAQHPLTKCCTDLRAKFSPTSTNHVCKEYGVGNEKEVTGIRLDEFDLTGTIPSFAALSLLTALNLKSNSLTGGFQGLGQLKHLVSLQLDNNQLSTVDDTQLELLTHLTLLELQNNRITSHTSEVWGKLKFLEHVDISSNLWQASLPYSMMNLTSVTYLNASNNPNLYGKLRVDYENWHNIVTLDLSNCKFGGYLEDGYGERWTKIQHLALRGNSFGDVIPERWGKMGKLTHLDLGNNQLQGAAPSWMSSAGGMKYLDFGKNALTGQVPNMGQLSSLTYLDLSNNHFSGSIPDIPDISKSPHCCVKMGGNSELHCPVKNYDSLCPSNNDFVASYSSNGRDNCGDGPTTTGAPSEDDGKLGGGYIFLIILCVLAIVGGVAYLAWKYYETQKKYEFDYTDTGGSM